MAILHQYLSRDQVGNRIFSLIKLASAKLNGQGNANKRSKLIEEIMKHVESNSRWLNIKEWRESIEEVRIKNPIDVYEGDTYVLIKLNYNLRDSRGKKEET